MSLCSCPVNLRSFSSWSLIPSTPNARQQSNGVCADTPETTFFAKSGVPRANSLTTSTMYLYYEELLRLDLMRRWCTTKDEKKPFTFSRDSASFQSSRTNQF